MTYIDALSQEYLRKQLPSLPAYSSTSHLHIERAKKPHRQKEANVIQRRKRLVKSVRTWYRKWATQDISLAGAPYEGLIYVIAMAADRHYIKIGQTNDPEQRVTHMRSGSPFHLFLLFYCRVKDKDTAEQELHAIFAECHMAREWFSLDHACIQACFEPLARIEAKHHGKTFLERKNERSSEKEAREIADKAIEQELKRQVISKSDGERTPFELLDEITYGVGNVEANKELFLEYVSASKGVNSLRWSTGLREKLGLKKAKTDAQILKETEEHDDNRRTP